MAKKTSPNTQIFFELLLKGFTTYLLRRTQLTALLTGLVAYGLYQLGIKESFFFKVDFSKDQNTQMAICFLIVWVLSLVVPYFRLSWLKYRYAELQKHHPSLSEFSVKVPSIIGLLFFGAILIQAIFAFGWVKFLYGTMPDSEDASADVKSLFIFTMLLNIGFWFYELGSKNFYKPPAQDTQPLHPSKPFLPEPIAKLLESIYAMLSVALLWNGMMLTNVKVLTFSNPLWDIFNLLLLALVYFLLFIPVLRYHYIEKALFSKYAQAENDNWLILSIGMGILLAILPVLGL
jgi:hypothetical protein